MDHQTQSYLDLSAMDDLAPLVNDKRAAWLWSADGARVLWANAAGAAFFSAHTISDLGKLTSLERSPARPHIARIASSGLTDRFSLDRLRFYRGLRVMLLTCQCKKIALPDGSNAALIVCGDKGFSTTKNPLTTFAHMLASENSTVFAQSPGDETEVVGSLTGTPEKMELPAEQRLLSGPIDLDGALHEGTILELPKSHRLIVLDNEALPPLEEESEDISDPSEETPVAGIAAVADAVPTEQGSDLSSDAEDTPHDEVVSALEELSSPSDPAAVDENNAQDDAEPKTDASGDNEAVPERVEEPDAPEAETTSSENAPVEDVATFEETSSDQEESKVDLEADRPSGFVFKPHRRPTRFAWKMDIDQRFTFVSDEFADVIGPGTTDILGLTWSEVAGKYNLDDKGSIGRALDRRDTWSGKTVDWPVSDAALRVPVDMAALPAFDRERKFEGYRGFGVCRTFDAVEDHSPCETEPADSLSEDEAPENDIVSEDEPSLISPAMAAFDDAFIDGGDPEEETSADAENPADSENSDQVADEASVDEEAETDTIEPGGDKSSDDVQAEPQNEDTVEDLKPAQPESLAGKTFIGASAAALVGTLAKFGGRKSDPEPATDPAAPDEDLETSPPELQRQSPGETEPAAVEDELIAEDADPGPKTPEEAEPTQAREETEIASVAALSSTEESEPATNGQSLTADETETEPSSPVDDTPAPADTSVSENQAENAEDLQSPETLPDSDDKTQAVQTQADQKPADQTRANQASEDNEPAGIEGSAPLDASEIETAVKSLAKSYDTKTKSAAPSSEANLFDSVSQDANSPADIDENEEAEDLDLFADADETQEDLDTGPVDELTEQTPFIKADAGENSSVAENVSIETEVPGDEETTAAKIGVEPIVPPAITSDDEADEREFFEETAAFSEEADTDASQPDDTTPEEKPSGVVIPLATARPRVVPVDTSGLSRPERQAFRKIAEALGARLEGDLEDFDEPDTEEAEDLDELPPEVPEAGPIDPSLLDRLPIGIAIVHDREVLYGNKALLKLLGYQSITELSEAGGLEALFIDDGEDLPDADGMDGEVDEPMKVRLADGGVRSVDAHMHSVPWNGGRGLMISITEHQPKAGAALETPPSPNFFANVRGELATAHSQIAEMDTILETATDGVLVLDKHGTIVKVNGSAEALFSASRGDMMGAPFTEFLAPESHRAASDYLDGLSRNGVASILNDGREVLGKVPSGGLIPLFMTMGKINEGEEEAKFCVVLRDITQWKTAEEELTQAKRQAENASSQKSDFLAKISHEIRTPLNAIIGFSEVMMEERFGQIGNERYKDYLKDIRTSGSHIMSLINDLLDLSKIEAGKLDLNFSSVSANEIINECVALMQPQANRERVIIRASLPDSVPSVVADSRSLRQIVLNLLSNAIKYNKSGGQVILSTALEANGEVALRVRDTGTGMTPKQLTAALEPFRQLHTASQGGGTGLGLPLTKALVEANRANFHIDSTPNQGTLVEITFPTQRVLSE